MKWRFFSRLLGSKDDDAERVYRWHIRTRRGANARVGVGMDKGKSTDDDYVLSAKVLASTMRREGFDHHWPIPVGPDGHILDGAHRLACAIALDIPVVAQPVSKVAWAPAWDSHWFLENQMPEADFVRLAADWNTLMAMSRNRKGD